MTEVTIHSEAAAFTEEVVSIRDRQQEVPVVAKLGGGILRFAEAAFPGVAPKDLLARVFERDGGIGAHFDVYDDDLDPAYPWVAVLNLAGIADVRTALLPEALSRSYRESFPDRTDKASDARRHYAGAALLALEEDSIAAFALKAGTGMVLSQKQGDLEVIHEVIPRGASKNGKFIKLVKGHKTVSGRGLYEHGYTNLDLLLTQTVVPEYTDGLRAITEDVSKLLDGVVDRVDARRSEGIEENRFIPAPRRGSSGVLD